MLKKVLSDSLSKWQAVKVSEIIIGSKSSGDLNNGDFQIELREKPLNIRIQGLWKLDEVLEAQQMINQVMRIMDTSKFTFVVSNRWSLWRSLFIFDGDNDHIILIQVNVSTG